MCFLQPEVPQEDCPLSNIYGRRVWVNQPSKNQPCHNLHGMNAIAIRYNDESDVVYPLAGKTISLVLPKSALSDGWGWLDNELAGEE